MNDRVLICLDIDGTLVGEDLIISKKTKDILNQLIMNNAVVYLVTGRMLFSGKVIANDISKSVQVIGSNGAALQLNNRVVFNGLTTTIIQKLVKLSYQYNFSLFLFGEKKVYYTITIPGYLKGDSGNRVHSNNADDYVHLTNENCQDTQQIANGIIVEPGEDEKLKAIQTILKHSFGTSLQLSSSNSNNIELIPTGIDKGTAIRSLQQHYGIDKEHTIVFGDGENDISMFSNSECSVAMGNAPEVVKSHAKYVTDDYQHDGVARFIKSYVIK